MDDDKLVVLPGGSKKTPEVNRGVLQLSERGREMLPEKRLTKRELQRFKDRVLAEYAPEAIVTMFEGLIDRSKRGDTLACQILGKITGMLEDKPQVAVQVNTTVNNGGGKRGRGMEALLREEQAQRMQLSASRETVIDAKVE